MKNCMFCVLRLKNFLLVMLVGVLAFSVLLIANVCTSTVVNLQKENFSKKVVIIDPGHGGEDGGTQSSDGVLEKDINLSISLKLRDILECLGIRCILTRDGDYMIYESTATTIREKKVSDIHARMSLMKNNKNSLFLSIHQNNYSQSKYYGAQVFYSGNNALSGEIAQSIQNSIVENLQPENTRKIKKSGTEIYLLYHAETPAVMVECGFMSNEAEADKLRDDEYQRKMALSIAEGIIKYVGS